MNVHDYTRTRLAPCTCRRWPAAAALAALLAFSGPAQDARAQDADGAPRPMTIVDLIEVPTLGDPRISPDGTRLLFVRRDADWEENGTVAHIWRVDADGGNLIQVTNGENGETSPRWSPDGSRVAFLARRGEDDQTQVYLLNAMGGEANALTEHPTAVSSIAWDPDGSGIYFVAADEVPEEEAARRDAGDDVYAFDENYQQSHIWRASVDDGEARRVTEGDYSVTGYSLSRDGTHIAFHRGESPLFEGVDRREVWVMRADGSDARQLTRNSVPNTMRACLRTISGWPSTPTRTRTSTSITTTTSSSSRHPARGRRACCSRTCRMESTRSRGRTTAAPSSSAPTPACAKS